MNFSVGLSDAVVRSCCVGCDGENSVFESGVDVDILANTFEVLPPPDRRTLHLEGCEVPGEVIDGAEADVAGNLF